MHRKPVAIFEVEGPLQNIIGLMSISRLIVFVFLENNLSKQQPTPLLLS